MNGKGGKALGWAAIEIGIGEGKAEEFGIRRREESRKVREFEGGGGDASHGARTLPSRFNSGAYLLS